jgi:hypothetical protein
VGTGKLPNDPNGFNIKPFAEKYGLWQTVVFEYPKRIPYLDVLIHLAIADAVFILGSTEPHYTPSKTYQAILSDKPILAVLHHESPAVNVLNQSGAGLVLDFNGEGELSKIKNLFIPFFQSFQIFLQDYNTANITTNIFDEYSAKAVTKKLVTLLDQI